MQNSQIDLLGKEYKLISIDPGNIQSAVTFCDVKNNKLLNQESYILENKKLKTYLTQEFIHYRLNKKNVLVLIEMISSYGMAVGKTTFDTAVWIGIFYQVAASNNVSSVKLITRKDVKMSLCGLTRATDSNITQRLIDLYGTKGTKKEPGFTYGLSKDMWQSFALAAAYIENPELPIYDLAAVKFKK